MHKMQQVDEVTKGSHSKGRVAGGGRLKAERSAITGTREQKGHRVTRRSQAHVPRNHAKYRNRTAVQCVARCGDKRPQQKGFSLKQYPGPTAGLCHFCMCIQGVLARRRAGGKHTSKAASCSAESPGRCGLAFRMPVAQMQAAPKKAAPRSWWLRL